MSSRRDAVGASAVPRPAGRAFATSATRGRTRRTNSDDRHGEDGREGDGAQEPVRRCSISSVRAGHDLEQVAHHAQVGDLQDRRVGVLR